MQHDHSPLSGGSDERLLGRLRDAGDPFPTAALSARHWQSVHDYVALFAPSGKGSGAVTSAVFGQVLETLRRSEEPPVSVALRPHLLGEARQVLARWAGDQRVAAVLPGLRAPGAPAENRQLIAHAYRGLPAAAQVLLWHREVEAEGLSIPAALLGIDPRDASPRLDEARALLREGCVIAQHDLAPDRECRHFGKLLDISLRRTGPLIPDIQRHLAACSHCRYAADQLRQSDGRLPLLLAEAVLGGGAERYLEGRPGRRRVRDESTGPGPGAGGGAGARVLRRAGRHARAVAARRRAPRSRGWRRPGGGALLTGLGVALSVLLLAAAVSGLWPDEQGGGGGAEAARPAEPGEPGSAGASGAPEGSGGTGGDGGAGAPGDPGASGGPGAPGASATATPAPPPAQAGHPTGGVTLRTRLRTTRHLCLDVPGGARDGAGPVLAACTGSVAQTWLYEPDGLLRNAAAPHLCLDSGRPDGTVVLAPCRTGPGVRYDVTLQGAVVPRGSATLALAPVTAEEGAALVVRLREDTPEQRWLTDGQAGGTRA
ncbi:ricin-type beta-trefoil lectin domain protein [Streptomyces sp. MUM 203J]|uniref:RICIN domain-containing protein n=1 Tax=Streptomyces sp. MUM 203J TaxID=2791990 RepID=UPI001F043E2E|nr:RICIN domain-containing protein [Streptomyces sp. MUM 203J]MCH0540185.1 ricin-type beta-trefoil lectin domain protein [Streptomyces sp. MUM 203J]